jgi:hypothetical protein
MTSDFTRNLRLVASTLLLSLWGYSHLAQTPGLGDTILPLVVALVIAPGSPFAQWHSGWSRAKSLFAVLFLLAVTALLYRFGTGQALDAFAHSPYFVVPVWTLGLIGLARNATSAERLAALASAATDSVHARDAGWPEATPPSADAAPASLSVRKRS